MAGKIGGISGNITGSYGSGGSGSAWTKALSSITGSEQRVGNSMPGDSANLPLNSVYKSPNSNKNTALNSKVDSIANSSLPKEYKDAINWKKNSVNDTTFLNLASKVVKDGLAGVKQLLQ